MRGAVLKSEWEGEMVRSQSSKIGWQSEEIRNNRLESIRERALGAFPRTLAARGEVGRVQLVLLAVEFQVSAVLRSKSQSGLGNSRVNWSVAVFCFITGSLHSNV